MINLLGAGPGVVLPVTQGIQTQGIQGPQTQAQTSCPAVSAIPPVSQCQGRVSNCWSVGQTDVDCIDNALCCFDGCANVCQGAGECLFVISCISFKILSFVNI